MSTRLNRPYQRHAAPVETMGVMNDLWTTVYGLIIHPKRAAILVFLTQNTDRLFRLEGHGIDMGTVPATAKPSHTLYVLLCV